MTAIHLKVLKMHTSTCCKVISKKNLKEMKSFVCGGFFFRTNFDGGLLKSYFGDVQNLIYLRMIFFFIF